MKYLFTILYFVVTVYLVMFTSFDWWEKILNFFIMTFAVLWVNSEFDYEKKKNEYDGIKWNGKDY